MFRYRKRYWYFVTWNYAEPHGRVINGHLSVGINQPITHDVHISEIVKTIAEIHNLTNTKSIVLNCFPHLMRVEKIKK